MHSQKLSRCRLLLLIAGLALIFSPAKPVLAWNPTGHMVVARIAWDNLTPQAKSRATDLLSRSASYGSWLRQMPAGYPDRALYVFMRSATWADEIRGTPASRPAWHYIDVPVVFGNDTSLLFAAPPPVVPNAETELIGQAYILGLTTAAPVDRADALCWVVHLTGDLHQPLHCAALFSSIFTRGDRGGNSIKLLQPPVIPSFGGLPVFSASPSGPGNLHALWDNLLGDTHQPDNIDRIAAVLKTPAYARGTFPQLKAHTDIHAWVLEGNALARQYVYLNGALPQSISTRGVVPGSHAETNAALPAGYVARAQSLALRQIALASYRLADTLNSVLGQ